MTAESGERWESRGSPFAASSRRENPGVCHGVRPALRPTGCGELTGDDRVVRRGVAMR
ncbi:hypothetical protein [Streptomyces sp. A 4/2]|uniref:hypothetical protein n=1 Tax=Streptomyces sp. A 4/2 TaxID=2934314 RepID=UPI0020249CD5|nr:hypothetical protein [Streptomyces sp. A 4/2]